MLIPSFIALLMLACEEVSVAAANVRLYSVTWGGWGGRVCRVEVRSAAGTRIGPPILRRLPFHGFGGVYGGVPLELLSLGLCLLVWAAAVLLSVVLAFTSCSLLVL